MTGRDKPKYMDIRGEYRFDVAMFRDHLNGRETYAVSLALAGYARAGCRDYDNASEAEMLAALRKASEQGLCAFLILMPGAEGHQGGHLWCLFDDDVPVSDIRAALRRLPGGKGELYPSGSRIRLPFGYHKLKQTRGALVLPSGERFDLDDQAQMRQAIGAVLNLPRNPAPEPASDAERRSDAAWGDAYKPEHWQDLPEGLPIWQSPRVERLSRLPFCAQLGQLLRGERVTLLQNGAPDDSDSAQVACLVFHLMGASFPEAEVRAVALALKDMLRPGRGLDHYRAHVDAEIERYRPRNYQPQATIAAGSVVIAAAPLQPAQHKPRPRGRPVGGRNARYEALRHILIERGADGERFFYSTDDLDTWAAELDCKRRTVQSMLAEFVAGGEVERGQEAGPGGRFWLMLLPKIWDANKSHASAPNGDAAEAADKEPALWDANKSSASETPVQRIETPESAKAPAMHRVYTPPVCSAEPEDVTLAPPSAPLVEVCRTALQLAVEGGVSVRKQRVFVRALVAAERPGTDDAAFDDAYGAARDFHRLEQKPTPVLEREIKMRRRYQARAQRAATQIPGGPVPSDSSLKAAWASAFATRRAEAVLRSRTGRHAPPDEGPEGRAQPVELAQLEILGSNDLAAERIRHKLRGRQLSDAIYGPRDWAAMVAPKAPARSVHPLPAPVAEGAPVYDARGMADRFRALKAARQAPPAAAAE
jgi:hypothetical protein